MGLQPENDPQVEFILNLWRRCKRYNCLPAPGGMLDQEERLMRLLDAVSDRVDERERLAQEAQQRKQHSQARSRR